MKNLFLGLLCLFGILNSSFAEEKLPPIGLEEMVKELSNVSDPADANGKIFNLEKPFKFEKAKLELKPANVFTIVDYQNGNVQIKIANASFLYDMKLFNGTGIVKMNPVDYVWIITDVVTPPDQGTGFQSCTINVGFKINNTTVTKRTLDYFKENNYKVILDFDSSILEFKGNTDGEYVFKRKNNDETTVSLNVQNPDGSLFANAIVSNIAKCEQSSSDIPVPTAKWSEWGTWSACSKTCGGGVKNRTRTCLTDSIGVPCLGNYFEEISCNTQKCEIEDPRGFISTKSASFKAKLNKLYYSVRYFNSHASKTIQCNIVITAQTVGTEPGEKVEFNVVLKPQQVSEWFEGVLKVGRFKTASDSHRSGYICKFVN